jgi:hypothetical protein
MQRLLQERDTISVLWQIGSPTYAADLCSHNYIVTAQNWIPDL